MELKYCQIFISLSVHHYLHHLPSKFTLIKETRNIVLMDLLETLNMLRTLGITLMLSLQQLGMYTEVYLDPCQTFNLIFWQKQLRAFRSQLFSERASSQIIDRGLNRPLVYPILQVFRFIAAVTTRLVRMGYLDYSTTNYKF